MLGLRFHQATQVEEHSKDHHRLRVELEALEKHTEQAVQALAAFMDRRRQFDEYLEGRQLRVLFGEPGDAELKVLLADFQDLAARHHADNRRLLRQLDGRRQPLTGHAEVRLSLHVREATGKYHDPEVESVFDELRKGLDQIGRGARHTEKAPRAMVRAISPEEIMRDDKRGVLQISPIY